MLVDLSGITYFFDYYKYIEIHCYKLNQAQKMTRRITGDQNNISSKLLGANLADINIEKFRDLTNYKKNKYEL